MSKFRLKLKGLRFVSPVDTPAQETARVLLTKRAGTQDLEFSAFAPTVKTVETKDDDGNPIGIVFCWAFTEKVAGKSYYDLQGDNVLADDDMIRAALDYVKRGAKTDQMHDGQADGFTPFIMPMNAEIASAFFGKTVDTSGLMVGLAPSPDVFQKFKSGEYTGVSIEGIGERQKVAAMTDVQCSACGQYMTKDAEACKGCGAVPTGKRNAVKSVWSTAMVDDFPDSSFLYVEPGGSKDSDGKTTPRSLRHFPYRDENGKIDLDHLRNAISRIPQSSLPATLRNKLQVKAEKLLAAQHTSKRFTKAALLTTAVAGHVHALDDGGDAPSGETDYRTMPGVADGGWHSHPWVRVGDVIVIGESENHTHEVADLAAIVAAGEADDDEDDASTGKRAGISTPTTTHKQGEPMKPIVLTEREHAHYSKLSDADREAFVSKSAAEREAIIKAAHDADPIVFKGEVTGVEVRKSDGDLAKKLAEQNEQLAKGQKAQAEQLAKAQTERDAEVLKARAKAELAHFPGDEAVKIDLLKRAGDDAKIAEVLKGVDAMLASLSQAHGVTSDSQVGPVSEFNAKHAEFAKSKNKTLADCAAEFVSTPEGSRLYKAAFPHTA